MVKVITNQLLPFDKETEKLGLTLMLLIKLKIYCKKNFKFFIVKEKWAPNSAELNPLDSFIWYNISNHVQYHQVKTIDDLRGENN